MNHPTKRDYGFTLIELLVVVAIVGLISSIAAVAIGQARQKPRNAKRVADVQTIQKALELYYAQNGGYPSVASATVLGAAGTKALCGTGTWAATCSGTPFLGLVPSAPVPVDGAGCNDANNAYTYASNATTGFSTSYALTFCVGAAVGSVSAGAHTASPTGIQ